MFSYISNHSCALGDNSLLNVRPLLLHIYNNDMDMNSGKTRVADDSLYISLVPRPTRNIYQCTHTSSYQNPTDATYILTYARRVYHFTPKYMDLERADGKFLSFLPEYQTFSPFRRHAFFQHSIAYLCLLFFHILCKDLPLEPIGHQHSVDLLPNNNDNRYTCIGGAKFRRSAKF